MSISKIKNRDRIFEDRRLRRERKTVETMVRMYCRDHHGTEDLCPDCESLFTYTQQRLDYCPFQSGKTTCALCPVHCYKPAMKTKIQDVMRYSGPRMAIRHPIMALWHWFDSFRKQPLVNDSQKQPREMRAIKIRK